MVIAPWLFQNYVIEATNSMSFFLASGLLFFGLFITKFYTEIKIILPNRTLITGIVLFYCINIISASWSLNVADAIFESQKIILLLVALVLFSSIFNSEESIKLLLKSIVLISLVCLIISYGEIKKFIGLTTGIQDAYFSIAGHKNLLSSFFYLLLPFSILAVFRFKKYWRVLSIANIILILGLIAILNTRSVQLSLAVAIITFFVFSLSAKFSLQLKKITTILFFSVGISAVVLLFIQASNADNKKATITTASLHERYQLWNNTFKLIQENPVIGVGAGNWQYNYSKFSVKNIESSRFYNTTFRRPHNDFLQVLAETGIIGFSLFIFLIGYVGFAALKKVLKEKDVTVLVIFCAFVGLLVDAFFSFPKERVTHLLIVALLLAIVLPLILPKSEERVRKSHVLFYFLLPILVFNIYVGWKRMYGEHYTMKSIEAQENFDPSKAIAYGNKSKSFFYSTDPTGTPIDSYIGWGYAGAGKLDSLFLVSESAYFLCPFDFKVLTNYGYVLIRLGQNHSAELVLKESFRINPNFEATLLNLSVLEYNRGNYTAAKRWLSRIADYEIKYPTNFKRIQEKLLQ